MGREGELTNMVGQGQNLGRVGADHSLAYQGPKLADKTKWDSYNMQLNDLKGTLEAGRRECTECSAKLAK